MSSAAGAVASPQAEPARSGEAASGAGAPGALRASGDAAGAGSRSAYVPWLSWARVVGIVAIVTIHVFGHLVLAHGQVTPLTWYGANLADAASRFGVPLFVMVSGAALLTGSPNGSLGAFYRRRFARIGIPLVVWTAFFLWFDRAQHGKGVSAYDVAQAYLWGRPYYHLYFLYLAAGLYAVTPFLRTFVAHARRSHLIAATALLLGIAAADRLQHAWMGGGGGYNAFTYFVPWLGYYLLGYLLATSTPAPRGRSRFDAPVPLAIGFVAAIGIATIGTWLLTVRWHTSNALLFYDYFVPTTGLAALCAGMLLRRLPARSAWSARARVAGEPRTDGSGVPLGRRLGDLTFGIFLLHPIPLALLIPHLPAYGHAVLDLGLHALVVLGLLVVCGAVTWLVHQVPCLRRLV